MPFGTFVQPVDDILVGKKTGIEVYVASVTVTMGWISAIRGARLRHEGEWRRDRPNSFAVEQVDIGNLELQEILPRSGAEQLGPFPRILGQS